MAEILELDANGRNVAGARDDSSNEVINLYSDGTSKTLRINNWVWNTSSLAWERMKQPSLELTGDLTVTLGDVERLLAHRYYLEHRREFDALGRLEYEGWHTTFGAATNAAGWLIKKYLYDAMTENCVRERTYENVAATWDGRAGYF